MRIKGSAVKERLLTADCELGASWPSERFTHPFRVADPRERQRERERGRRREKETERETAALSESQLPPRESDCVFSRSPSPRKEEESRWTGVSLRPLEQCCSSVVVVARSCVRRARRRRRRQLLLFASCTLHSLAHVSARHALPSSTMSAIPLILSLCLIIS